MKKRILLSFVLAGVLGVLLIHFPAQETNPPVSVSQQEIKKVWFEIIPKQCEQPELRTGDFFQSEGIQIHERKWVPRDEIVCAACGCPEPRTLALLVSESDEEKMIRLGFVRSAEPRL